MKTPYERHQEQERKREIKELESIIDKPHLTPKEIWEITPDNFFLWRKKHDFPRILVHFKEKLSRFEEWQKEFKFTDESLISFGISNCVTANPSQDKRKFIVETTWEGKVSLDVSYQNINGKFYNLGPNKVNHKVISSFIGYVDWCNSKNIKIIKGWNKNSTLISGPSSSHPIGVPQGISISILDGLELLKVGGLEVKKDILGLIKPKYFEFVNADYIKISGEIATAGRELIFENSFVDGLYCENLNLGLVKFNNCSLNNFYSLNSTLQQWTFSSSIVNGKALNSDLSIVSVYGGSFNIDFKDSTFYDVNARGVSESTYRTFKTVYASQGDDKKAIEYFLLEKSEERKRIKNQIFTYERYGLFTLSKKELLIKKTKSTLSNLYKFVTLSVNNFYWGYGRKPFRVVRNSVLLILIFALIYFYWQSSMSFPESQKYMTFGDSLYFSTVTFTTLGYGDFAPLGFMRIVAGTEAFFGGISLGFLVAGFSNFKY